MAAANATSPPTASHTGFRDSWVKAMHPVSANQLSSATSADFPLHVEV
jgi:hypothetical protein